MRLLLIQILLAVQPVSVDAPLAIEALETPAGIGSLAPGLAELADGEALLSWLEPIEDGYALRWARLSGDRFSDTGTVSSGPDWFANWADTPAMFALPNGDWLAHWLVRSGPSAYAYDIKLARSTDRGRSWSMPLSPHRDATLTEHGFVSYFAWSDDAIGLAWLDGRHTQGREGAHGHGSGGAMTLRTAVIGPDGVPRLEAVLDERVCDCCQTAAALTAEGPVVAYRDRGADETRDIAIVRWAGIGWSPPAPVHDDGWVISACPVNGPAADANHEHLAVAWFTMSDGVPAVKLAFSADGGRRFAAPHVIASGTVLGRVAVRWLDERLFLLWMDEQEGRGSLELAVVTPDLGIVWRGTLASVEAGRAGGFPRLVPSAGGRMLVAWTEGPREHTRVRAALVHPTGPMGAGASKSNPPIDLDSR